MGYSPRGRNAVGPCWLSILNTALCTCQNSLNITFPPPFPQQPQVQLIFRPICLKWASQGVLVVKNPPANAGDTGDVGSIPGSERSSGVGNGYLLQYSCLKNPTDREAWRATICRVAKSRIRLKPRSTSTRTHA